MNLLTFRNLKLASYAHSCIYAALLLLAVVLDRHGPGVTVLGFAHGIGWITLSLASIEAVRRRVIPMHIAVLQCVVGGIGPFAGSAGYWLHEKRTGPAAVSG